MPPHPLLESDWINVSSAPNNCRYKEAELEFKQALLAAKVSNDKQIQTFSKVQIGICRGNIDLAFRKESLEEIALAS